MRQKDHSKKPLLRRAWMSNVLLATLFVPFACRLSVLIFLGWEASSKATPTYLWGQGYGIWVSVLLLVIAIFYACFRIDPPVALNTELKLFISVSIVSIFLGWLPADKHHLYLSSTERPVITAGNSEEVVYWDKNTINCGFEVLEAPFWCRRFVSDMHPAQDEFMIALGNLISIVYLPQLEAEEKEFAGKITDIEYQANGDAVGIVIESAGVYQVQLWDSKLQEMQKTLTVMGDQIAISPNSEHMLSYTQNGNVLQLFDLQRETKIDVQSETEHQFVDIQFFEEETAVAVSAVGDILEITLFPDLVITVIEPGGSDDYCCSHISGSDQLVAHVVDDTIYSWDIQTREMTTLATVPYLRAVGVHGIDNTLVVTHREDTCLDLHAQGKPSYTRCVGFIEELHSVIGLSASGRYVIALGGRSQQYLLLFAVK